MGCCYGRLGLLEYSYSSDIALNLVKTLAPKLRGKSGGKPHCDAGGIPSQFGRLDSCLLSAAGAVQSREDGG